MLLSSQRLLWDVSPNLWYSPYSIPPTAGSSENSRGSLTYTNPFCLTSSKVPTTAALWHTIKLLVSRPTHQARHQEGSSSSPTIIVSYVNGGAPLTFPGKGSKTGYSLCSAICFWFPPTPVLKWHRGSSTNTCISRWSIRKQDAVSCKYPNLCGYLLQLSCWSSHLPLWLTNIQLTFRGNLNFTK